MNIEAWTAPVAARFPQWEEEQAPESESVALPCITGEAEVGYLLPQLLATPGCPSRSRVLPPLRKWLWWALVRRVE